MNKLITNQCHSKCLCKQVKHVNRMKCTCNVDNISVLPTFKVPFLSQDPSAARQGRMMWVVARSTNSYELYPIAEIKSQFKELRSP